MFYRIFLVLFLFIDLLFAADIQVFDDDIKTGDTVLWTSDNVYHLNGFVFVDSGAVLKIEAGTVIKGKPGQGENASALIIARGAKIYAEGTREKPIIFTAEADDLTKPDDIPLDASGLWGGLILLGRARINTAAGEGHIEGIPETEPRGAYGGNNDHDNSGILRYVSVRYGGTDIGAGNEINGITFGAVGDSTVVDYVEVFGNNDDGMEFFGGTVCLKHIVLAYNKDDNFDTDEGFRGKGQFLFVLQSPDFGDRAGEHDGGTEPEDGTPYAKFTFFNATFIGSGVNSSNLDNMTLKIRDNSGGCYCNSIFTDFAGIGIDIEDLESGADSRERLECGDLLIKNNIWWNFGKGNDWLTIAHNKEWIKDSLLAMNNVLEDPLLKSISRINNKMLDPRPSNNSPAFENLTEYPEDGFFEKVNFKGAFGKELWIKGWTFLDNAGFIVNTQNTDINENTNDIKTSFELLGNYPNPFNPSTKIVFSIHKPSKVELSVYNIMGEKVATLLNNSFHTAGKYNVVWNPSDNIGSGTYFYILRVKDSVKVGKMILLR